ncbi:ATP-binding protein [Pseudomonas sp. NBRC 100443]|uniref:ATP-binding protein n=1 Tax=Pseudomonas sp. NBRC 100443 TaxID=1113665 RepID=UPI0024A58D06|nr:ATP-binding protein [Pseudomonas sp. NBRC 100443]GLU37158.1 ATPase AAA [Pseudomonas sp. NBRC 100443]
MTARISNFVRAPERTQGPDNGAECPVHGRYTEVSVEQYGGGMLANGCPACHFAGLRTSPEGSEQHLQALQVNQQRKLNALLIGSGITPRFRNATFQSYQADGSVPMAQVLVRCRDFAEQFPEHYEAGRSLLLVGNVGTGKTHLGSAIAQHVIREHGAQAVITSAAQIIRVAKGAMARSAQYTERDVIEELVGFDLLVIDEVGAQGGTEYERSLLHEVIDQRYQQVLPTVLISNLPADTAAAQAGELTLQDFIGERALDRLRQGGRAVRFTWGSARGGVPA